MCREVRQLRQHASCSEGPDLLEWAWGWHVGPYGNSTCFASAEVSCSSSSPQAFLWDLSSHLHWARAVLLNTSVGWLLPLPFQSFLRSPSFCITVPSMSTAFSLRALRETERERGRQRGREREKWIDLVLIQYHMFLLDRALLQGHLLTMGWRWLSLPQASVPGLVNPG